MMKEKVVLLLSVSHNTRLHMYTPSNIDARYTSIPLRESSTTEKESSIRPNPPSRVKS
jgi:hypothetical protein